MDESVCYNLYNLQCIYLDECVGLHLDYFYSVGDNFFECYVECSIVGHFLHFVDVVLDSNRSVVQQQL